MPDHLHILADLPADRPSAISQNGLALIQRSVSHFELRIAYARRRRHGWRWQKLFRSLLRSDESSRKMEYLRQIPCALVSSSMQRTGHTSSIQRLTNWRLTQTPTIRRFGRRNVLPISAIDSTSPALSLSGLDRRHYVCDVALNFCVRFPAGEP